jgi:hypothetical protein
MTCADFAIAGSAEPDGCAHRCPAKLVVITATRHGSSVDGHFRSGSFSMGRSPALAQDRHIVTGDATKVTVRASSIRLRGRVCRPSAIPVAERLPIVPATRGLRNNLGGPSSRMPRLQRSPGQRASNGDVARLTSLVLGR